MEGILDGGLTAPSIVVTGLSLILGLYVLYNVVRPTFSETNKFYKTQSWVGVRKELFANLKAQGRTLGGFSKMIEEGYEKYSKNGKAFMMPLFASEPLLILPPSKMKQVSSWPEHQLNADIMHQESLMSSYTIGADISGGQAYHFDVVRRQLTRKLPLLTQDIAQELLLGFDDKWGKPDSFTPVKLYPSAMRLVSRAANRVFAGKELCRNEEFLEQSKLYTQESFGSAAKIRLFPSFLRPIVAPILVRRCNTTREKALEQCLPVVAHRLRNTQKKAEDPDFQWEAPNDALQWLIEECISRGDPAEMHPHILSRRLLSLNMVAIHTTSMGITNTLLDIYSSPDATAIVDSLREECTRALAANGGQWTKDAINSMHRHDSAIRESMRASDLGSIAMQRIVLAKDGIDLGDGIQIPHGVRVAVPSHHMHHDSSVYPDAHVYNPFRFSAPREAYEADVAKARAAGKSEADVRKILELKNQALITVSPSFLSFGNGMHACPGRFFASQEMKLMLATVVMHYDVKPLQARPKNVQLTVANIPSDDAEIEVRRRW